MGKDRGLGIGDLLGLDHDVKLATSLHGVGALHTLVGVGDLLELLESLNVGLGTLATCTGARRGDGVGSHDKLVEDRVGLDVGVVRLDGMHDFRTLTITAREVGTDDRVGALDRVVNGLAKVVEKAGALGCRGIKTKLGGHHAAELGDLLGVLKHVLSKRGAVAEGAERLDDLRVQVVNARIEGGLLASLLDALVNEPSCTSPRCARDEFDRPR